MYCSKCGNQIKKEWKHCPKCGAELSPSSVKEVETEKAPAQEAQSKPEPNLWIFLGIVFALIALFLLPPLFGGLGVYFGYRAKQAGSEGGGIAIMVVSAACMLLGMLIGATTWGF